jgi:hypothetical protein
MKKSANMRWLSKLGQFDQLIWMCDGTICANAISSIFSSYSVIFSFCRVIISFFAAWAVLELFVCLVVLALALP